MESPSQEELWLVLFLSLVGLALIWLKPLQLYPSTLLPYISLIPYVLLFFLPGYAIITTIKPRKDEISPAIRIVISFILGLLFLLLIPIAIIYFQLSYLENLIPTLLFLLTIFFTILAILRRSAVKDLEGQITLDESIKRIKVIKRKAEQETVPSEEMHEYTPMPAEEPEEPEEPSQKNRMSVMRLYDTGKTPETDKKSINEEKINDIKPIREEILRLRKEEKNGEKTIPLQVEQAVKKEDLLSAFQTEMGKPVWLDHMNDDKTGFRNWDLLLALLLSGLAVSLSYYNPLRTPQLTTVASYAMVLFMVAYTLLVVIFPDRKKIGLLNRIVTSSLITILLLILILNFGNTDLITSLPLPLILFFALATLILVLVAALRRRSLPPESTELGLEEIIRRAEELEILVEHDEETLKTLKELEKEINEEPPTEEKQPPKEEIPVIIVEHDEKDKGEWDTETIIVDHDKDDEKGIEETSIIVEHDEGLEKDIEEEPAKEEVEKEEPHYNKYESKPSLLPTEKVTKVDKAYPAEEISKPKDSEKKKTDTKPPESTTEESLQPEESVKEETETESKVPPKKEVETKSEPSSRKEGKKEKIGKTVHEPVKEQFNYGDLVLVPLFACLSVFYIIIPLFPKTSLTVMVANSLLFILAGYSLVVALYPKKFDAKRLITGILLGIFLAVAYQIALFSNYFTFFSGNIRLWLLIFILIFCLITYFRRRRAAPSDEILQPKKDFKKSNIINLISEVIREREEKEKTEPIPKEEDPFLTLRSRAEPVKADSGKSIKKDGHSEHGRFMNFFRGLKASFQGEPRTQVVLSVILIIALLIAISATAYIIIKPKPVTMFTEFYILGPGGTASNYPTNLTAGQQGKLIIGVVNHEYATFNYQLVVKMNNNIIQSQTISLQNNAKKEIPINFTAGPPGQSKLEFLLYKLPDNQKVYRSLHL